MFAERHGAELIAPSHGHVDLTDQCLRVPEGELRARRHPRAQYGTLARIAGLQGVHRARPDAPRAQDAGFGYLVASRVDAPRAGERFTVWDGLNLVATLTLASDAAELIWRALEREVTGILHCCGGEHIDRLTLAYRAIDAFDLEPELLDVGLAPAEALAAGEVPRGIRLDGTTTARALAAELPDLDAMLGRLRVELEHSGSLV